MAERLLCTQRGDTLTYDGAHALVDKLTDYWARRGVEVRAWASPVTNPGTTHIVWVVRSNILEKIGNRNVAKISRRY